MRKMRSSVLFTQLQIVATQLVLLHILKVPIDLETGGRAMDKQEPRVDILRFSQITEQK